MNDKPSVGILAYGSLIPYPGDEIEAVLVRRVERVETPFAIEYARRSNGRGGAPTLVPFERGAKVMAQVLVVNASVEDATHMLYRREIGQVGSDRRYEHREKAPPGNVIVERATGLGGIDVVLSTRIGWNIKGLSADRLAEFAIRSVAKTDPGKDGITYLMDAVAAGIDTPLTQDYQAAVLAKSGTASLAEALDKLRAE